VTQITNHHSTCMLTRMVKLLARWFLLAAALLLTAHFYPGIQVQGYGAALAASLIIGLLNTVLRPVLVVLTLPVTIVTLGLFLFVVNAVVFYSAAWLLPGLQVAGFTAALVASLLYSLCGIAIDAVLERVFDER
jgi:putative membrane protein